MTRFKEEDFIFVKEQLTDGYISPIMTRPALIIFLIVSLIPIGIASAVVFIEDSVIGWDGLSPFWQGIFIAEAILLIIQLLIFLVVRKINNLSQIILVIAYMIFTIKLALDFFLLAAMFLMDAYMYENMKGLLLAIFLLGIVILFSTITIVIRMMKKNKVQVATPTKKKKGKIGTTIFAITFPLGLFVAYVLREDILSIEAEMIYMLFIVLGIYYCIMIASALPVFGVYCWIKYPSFRIEANMKKKKSEEKRIK